MCDKMAISAYILKIVEKDPFLRLQMRAKEMFDRDVKPSIQPDHGVPPETETMLIVPANIVKLTLIL